MMDVAGEIAQLDTVSPADLRLRWSAVTGSEAPKVSPKLLRLALAWELKARVHGGLPRDASRTLDQLAGGLTKTAAVQPDMRLMREWQGKAHVVTIGEDRIIRWDGRTWGSLSQVARAITGTRWSGPAFFGLKVKAKVAA